MKSKKNLSVNVDTLSELGNTISETVYNTLNQPLTITDDMGKVTTFNLDLVRNEQVIIDKMF